MKMTILYGLAEGQVLQRLGSRGAAARVGGTVSMDGVVFASIRLARGAGASGLKGWARRRVGVSTDGVFEVKLTGIPSGGPYRLELECGAACVRVKSFFVGDVWLLAGQSNMEGCGHFAFGRAKPHALIRAFSMRREWRRAEDPLHVPWESPDIALHGGDLPFTREQAEDYRRTAFRGVGLGVFFAREMHARSGVPQGLVCTARGATQMRQWCPDPNDSEAGALHAAMLRSVRATGQPLAGVLWHQGEGDSAAERAALYTARMRRLIAVTRRALGQPDLPWIIGQLARVYGERKETAWNSVQEQQRQLATKISNAALVATIDLPLDDFIHLGAAAFPRLGRRFARAADRLVYRNKMEVPEPALRSISRMVKYVTSGEGRIDVVFANVVGDLRAGGEPQGFSLLDAAGQYVPAIYKTTLHGDTARLYVLPEYLSAGLRVSYGHGNAPICNIADAADRAIPVFGPQRVRFELARQSRGFRTARISL